MNPTAEIVHDVTMPQNRNVMPKASTGGQQVGRGTESGLASVQSDLSAEGVFIGKGGAGVGRREETVAAYDRILR